MTKDVKMSAMAQDLGVSERTIIRRFQATLHQSPLRYLQSLRIEAARALLEAGDLSLERITARVGYSDTARSADCSRRRSDWRGAYRDRFRPAAESR